MTAPILLDGGARGCVRLLIELRHLTHTVPAGTVVHLITIDPAVALDLPVLCRLAGHTYLGPVPPAGRRPMYAVQVAGGAAVTDPAHPWRPTTSA